MEYDVIIVGAGPAGTAAAITLARGGEKVLIVDSAPFPREKACGDGLLPGALSILAELGVLPKVLSGPGRSVAKIHVHAPSGATLTLGLKPQSPGRRFFITGRYDFDHLLLQQALHSGATILRDRVTDLLRKKEIITGVRVRNQGQPVTITARTVIGADGSASIVRRRLMGEPPPVDSIAIRAYLEPCPDPADAAHFFFHPDLFPGYAWVFPLSTTRVNIGLGLDLMRHRESSRKLEERLKSFLRHALPASWRLADAEIRSLKSGSYWFLALHPSPVAGPGALLTGDAAGLMDPLSGEGIRNALRSGIIAGETALQMRDRRRSPEQLATDYTARIQRTILPGLTRSLRLQRRFLRSTNQFNRLIGTARRLYPLARPWLSRFSTNFNFE
ncbi:MAG: NAD(P)/FAD-dependent oxidoreductase [Fidelibacterota bacterium]